MDTIIQFFQNHLPWVVQYKYVFLFLGSFIEANSFVALGGALSSLRAVNVFIAYPLIILAHTLNGCLFYCIGYFGGMVFLDRWKKHKKSKKGVFEKLKQKFVEHSGKVILFGKMTYGVQTGIMILAGSLKYDLKKFLKYNLIGSFGWVTLIFGIGYFFGQGFKGILDKIIRGLEYFILSFGIGILIILIVVILKKFFIKSLFLEDTIRRWGRAIKKQAEYIIGDEENKEDKDKDIVDN